MAAAGVLPLPKRLVIDLGQMPGVLDKIEGVALLTARRIAIVNDNDFNIGAFDNDGNTTGTGDPNVLVTITLDRPLK